MINAAEDEVIPRACTEKLAQALGSRRPRHVARRAGPLHGDGRAAPRLADDRRVFRPGLARRRPGGDSRAGRSTRIALQRLVAVLQQAITILVSEPAPGRCHFVDLESVGLCGHGPAVRRHMCAWSAGAGTIRAAGPPARTGRRGPGPGPLSLAGGRRKDARGRHEKSRRQHQCPDLCRAPAPARTAACWTASAAPGHGP